MWQRISEHLFLFRDTCSVYALVHDSEAVLVDFGSGAVLDHLGEIGVGRVAAILHTHHHRDQCQGDQRAMRAGIPIYVPEHERRLFEHAELFWASKQIFDVYNVRNTYFSLTQDVRVAGSLVDFSDWMWGTYTFTVIATPGHSLGSLTLLVDIGSTTTTSPTAWRRLFCHWATSPAAGRRCSALHTASRWRMPSKHCAAHATSWPASSA